MKTDEPVWVVVMFDLPVETAQLRKEATQYRLRLLNLGFSRIQLSVYARYIINSSGIGWLSGQISYGIPAEGRVRMLSVSDKEWSKTLRFEGLKLEQVESPPEQLLIF